MERKSDQLTFLDQLTGDQSQPVVLSTVVAGICRRLNGQNAVFDLKSRFESTKVDFVCFNVVDVLCLYAVEKR